MAFQRKNKPPKDIGTESATEQEILPPATRSAKGQFLPGNKLGGRPKGAKSRLAEAFVSDLLSDWQVNGAQAIKDCRKEDPATYVKVVASLVPKDMNIREGESTLDAILDQFDDNQLEHFITGLLALGSAQEGAGQKTKAVTHSKSNKLH